MRINVTAEDIRKSIKAGGRGNPTTCPIARAVRRETGRKYVAAVYNLIIGDSSEYKKCFHESATTSFAALTGATQSSHSPSPSRTRKPSK